ncbi:MAG: hypothetical protein FLDDKLPJ_02901 [Phycisphaerae bacterium]|nr:hypothetical protein [Phycisphaerae bacterium]
MTFSSVFGEFLGTAAQVLCYGTILAGVTWLLCGTVLRRWSGSWLAALWVVVLLRFAVPPVLPGSATLAGLLRFPVESAAASLADEEVAAVSDVAALHSDDPSLRKGVGGAAGVGGERAVASAPAVMSLRTWWTVPVLMYAAGVLYFALRWRERRQRLVGWLREQPVAEAALLRRVESLAQRIGLRRRPDVRVTDEPASPFVTGLFRPVLVLPREALRRAPAAAADAMILHELAHLRRGDVLIRALENLLRTFFFFWPPLWWVCRQIERYSEMACDQLAVRASGVCAADYAACLLNVVQGQSERRPVVASALAFARDGRVLEERFNMILHESAMVKRTTWLMAPVLAAWAVFALGGGAVRAQEKQEGAPADNPPPQRPAARAQIDLDQPVPAERAKALLEQYGEEGIDANADGTLTRREVFEFYRKKGLPLPGRPGEGGPGGGPGRFGPGRPGPDGPFQMLEAFERLLRLESGKVAPERVLNAFPRADRDQNGQLSEEEMKAALDRLRQQALERLLEVQPQVDADKDGKVSDEEFAAFKETTLARLAERVFASQPEADKDRDGKFSEEEFLAWREAQAARQREEMLKRHPDADTDGDGKLSDEEFRAASEKHRGELMRGPGGAGGGPGPRRPGAEGAAGPRRPLPGEPRPEGEADPKAGSVKP